jgi:hypothetical protein
MAGCLYSQRRSSPLHSLTQFVENTYHYYAVRPLEFHTCVYYVVVSITTTGYGDVTPHSDTGQGVVIAMLLWSFIQVGVRGVDLEPVGVVAPHLHARTYTSCRAHKSRITYTRTCMHAHHPPPGPWMSHRSGMPVCTRTHLHVPSPRMNGTALSLVPQCTKAMHSFQRVLCPHPPPTRMGTECTHHSLPRAPLAPYCLRSLIEVHIQIHLPCCRSPLRCLALPSSWPPAPSSSSRWPASRAPDERP